MTQGIPSSIAEHSDSRICGETGYALRKLPRLGVWKVFDVLYDPLSSKPHELDDRESWYRFDLEYEPAVYGASDRQGAFAETLAPLRPRIDELNALAREVFDEGLDDFEGIEEELSTTGMNTSWLPSAWRSGHGVAQITARTSEWFVDVDSIHTINALRQELAPALAELARDDLDVADVRSRNRALTCQIAEHLSWATLDDGSSPMGVRFVSRHGSDLECWAIWGRAVPFVVGASSSVDEDDPAYREILRAFNLQTR